MYMDMVIYLTYRPEENGAEKIICFSCAVKESSRNKSIRLEADTRGDSHDMRSFDCHICDERVIGCY